MACLCGDTHCHSCGPAQGNWKCPICRCWADDGCEHIDEDTGDLKFEFQEQARLLAEAEAQADNQFAADLEAEAALAEADWAERESKPKCPSCGCDFHDDKCPECGLSEEWFMQERP